jgi:2-succinyl-6-hydroxy-2,4-cyclohexadiene-1-carboxylate synthase
MPMRINDLDYNVMVEGSGEPLLLLHGFTGSAADWTRIVADLGDTFTCIAVDLPGHGATGKPADPARYQMEAVAADLVALLAEIAPGPVCLHGYSMGGRLALYLAAHYPAVVAALSLESASPGLKTEMERRQRRESDEALAARIERDGIAAFVDYWESLPLWESQRGLPPKIRAAQREQRLANDPAGLANSLRGMGTGVQPSLWDALPGLRLPVTLLAGERDRKFTVIAEQMRTAIPRAALAIAPGAGHNIHLEQPMWVAQRLRDQTPSTSS